MHIADNTDRTNIDRAMVVGAGWVGRQIAARIAQYGVSVVIMDRDVSAVADALSWLELHEHLHRSFCFLKKKYEKLCF